MTDFTQIYSKLHDAINLAEQRLGVSAFTDSQAGTAKDFSGKLGANGSFSAGIGAAATVQLLNAAGDKDESMIFGSVPVKPAGTVQWVPLLDADDTPERCWLKYALRGAVKAGAKLKNGPVSFGLDSGVDLQLSSYLPHPPVAKLGAAILADLPRIPQILSVADVAGLTAGQAVAIELHGQLSFKLTLAWSDLLANTINPLADLAQGGKALAISIKGGVEASFAIALDSRFRVVFVGLDPDWLQLQVWRNDQRTTTAALSAGLTVKFVDPDAAAKVLGGVASALLSDLGLDPNELRGTIDGILAELSSLHAELLGLNDGLRSKLDAWLASLAEPAERALQRMAALQSRLAELGFDATRISQQLGSTLEEATDLIGQVRAWPARLEARMDQALEKLWASLGLNRIEDQLKWLLGWLNKLEAGIVSIARSKVELGFKYEWVRTKQSAALVQMKIKRTITNLAAFHSAALSLDGAELLRLANAAAGNVVDGRLLGQRIEEKRVAYGFTLGIGKWAAWSKWKSGEKLVHNERQLQGQPQILVQNALTGYAEYADEFFGPDHLLRGDLSVAQHDFQQADAPGQWELGLCLQSQVEYSRLSVDQLDSLLDHAVLWACLDPTQLSELRASLDRLTHRKLRANLQMKLSNSAFANLRFNNLLSIAPGAEYVQAVAGAIPWMKYAERRTVQAREVCYGLLARELVDTPNDPGDYDRARYFARRAAQTLRLAGASTLMWKFEQRQSEMNVASFSAGSIARLAHLNGTFRSSRDRVAEGLERLSRLSSANTVAKGVELARESLNRLQGEWQSGLRLRAFGRLLVLLHRKAEAPARSLATSLNLEVLGANDKVTETVVLQPMQ